MTIAQAGFGTELRIALQGLRSGFPCCNIAFIALTTVWFWFSFDTGLGVQLPVSPNKVGIAGRPSEAVARKKSKGRGRRRAGWVLDEFWETLGQ